MQTIQQLTDHLETCSHKCYGHISENWLSVNTEFIYLPIHWTHGRQTEPTLNPGSSFY